MAEPMSDDRLAEAQRNHAAYKASHAHDESFACCSAHASADDVPELLAEVERLREALKRAWQLYDEAERNGAEARAGWQAAERRISKLKQARTEAAP